MVQSRKASIRTLIVHRILFHHILFWLWKVKNKAAKRRKVRKKTIEMRKERKKAAVDKWWRMGKNTMLKWQKNLCNIMRVWIVYVDDVTWIEKHFHKFLIFLISFFFSLCSLFPDDLISMTMMMMMVSFFLW